MRQFICEAPGVLAHSLLLHNWGSGEMRDAPAPLWRPHCHTVRPATLWGCHTARPATLRGLPHCEACHTVRPATLRGLSHCEACHTVRPVTLWGLPHCEACHTVRPATLRGLPHCEACHTVDTYPTHACTAGVKQCLHVCVSVCGKIILKNTSSR